MRSVYRGHDARLGSERSSDQNIKSSGSEAQREHSRYRRSRIERLGSLSGKFRAAVAQGAAFAAKTRQQANNPTEHTELACQILCELDADAAAQLTDATRRCLPDDGKVPAYEIWRQRIQSYLPWS